MILGRNEQDTEKNIFSGKIGQVKTRSSFVGKMIVFFFFLLANQTNFYFDIFIARSKNLIPILWFTFFGFLTVVTQYLEQVFTFPSTNLKLIFAPREGASVVMWSNALCQSQEEEKDCPGFKTVRRLHFFIFQPTFGIDCEIKLLQITTSIRYLWLQPNRCH